MVISEVQAYEEANQRFQNQLNAFERSQLNRRQGNQTRATTQKFQAIQSDLERKQSELQTLSQRANVAIEKENQEQNNTQNNLIQKYQAGTITLQEFAELRPDLFKPGGSQTKVLTAYILYRKERGLPTKEFSSQLPTSGQSYTSFGGIKKSSSSNLSGGFSSISGETGYVSPNLSPLSNSFQLNYSPALPPASFTFTPKLERTTTTYSESEITQIDTVLRQQPTLYKKPAPVSTKEIDLRQRIDFTQDVINDTRSMKTIIQKNSVLTSKEPQLSFQKVNEELNQFVGEKGARIGQNILREERLYTKYRLENAGGFDFSNNFLKQTKTIEESEKELRLKLNMLNKAETLTVYRETGANVLLSGQYLTPLYGTGKILLDVGSDLEQKKYLEAIIGFSLGASFGAGERIGGKVLDRLALQFSETKKVVSGTAFRSEGKFVSNFLEKGSERKLLLGEKVKLPAGVIESKDVIGYKDIITERFVSKKVGLSNEIGLKSVEALRTGINLSGKSYVFATFGQSIVRPSQDVMAGFSDTEIRARSVESSKELGFFIAGYSVVNKGIPQIDPLIYRFRTQNKEIPYDALKASDVVAGLTKYPKDTLNVRKYISSVKNRRDTAQGLEQSTYFNEEVFQNQEFAFNVSGVKPIRYEPIKGNSEFTFAEYSNPKNPSFIFQINKRANSVLSGYRLGFELPTGARAKANVTYSRGIKQIEVGAERGDILFRTGERGVQLVPTQRGLRTKTESEVLTVGKILKIKENKFTVERDLSRREEGLLFGKVFEIPEYRVSKSQRKTVNPYTVEAQVRLLTASEKEPISFKPTTKRELELLEERSRLSESYYQRKPVIYPYRSDSSSSRITQLDSRLSSRSSEKRSVIPSVSFSSGLSSKGSSQSSSSSFSIGSSSNPSSFPSSSIRSPPSSSRFVPSGSSSISRDSSLSSPTTYPYPSPSVSFPTKNPTRIGSPKRLESPRKPAKMVAGYDVYAKRNIDGKRQFVEIDGKTTSLSERDALTFGENVVDNALEKSVVLKPSTKPVVPLKGLSPLDYKFRLSKSKASQKTPVYVEKNEYGLDTRGEVKKIQAYKLASKYRKKYIGTKRTYKNFKGIK